MSNYWCSFSKTASPVVTHGQSAWNSALSVTEKLPLGLLRPWLDGLGSSAWFCCFRSDSHRPNASLCRLSPPMAIFCAPSWTSPSPNWSDVASQSAQHGDGAGECLSNNHFSTPLAPLMGDREKEENSGDTPAPSSILLHRSHVGLIQPPQSPFVKGGLRGVVDEAPNPLHPTEADCTLFCHSRGGGNPGVATGIALQPPGPHSSGEKRSGTEGHHRTPGIRLRRTAPFQARAVLVRARKEIDSVVSKK